VPRLTKDEVELKYLEMARAASSVIPTGEALKGEKPDVRIQTPSGLLGVEITRLHHPPQPGEARTPMEKRALRHKVVKYAKSLYDAKGGPPVTVEVFFSQVNLSEHWKEVSECLAQLVRERAPEVSANGKAYPFGVYSPNHFQQINICVPLPGCSEWREVSENDRPQVLRYEDVDGVVATKTKKLLEYQSMTLGTWLLMVVDPFPRAAYVCVPEDVSSWGFTSDFGKILLFSREDNRVFELGKS
jgi:hypothetical protein